MLVPITAASTATFCLKLRSNIRTTVMSAGFSGSELSALWPPSGRDAWRLTERAAMPFSHCLLAERTGSA